MGGSIFFRGVFGQLPSLKDGPDQFYIDLFVAYILKILGQREGVRNPMTPPPHLIRPCLLH